VRAFDCCDGPIEAHHVKTRGAGGLAKNNLIGLCLQHHSEIHGGGVRFFAMAYDIDAKAEATRLWTAHYGEETEDE